MGPRASARGAAAHGGSWAGSRPTDAGGRPPERRRGRARGTACGAAGSGRQATRGLARRRSASPWRCWEARPVSRCRLLCRRGHRRTRAPHRRRTQPRKPALAAAGSARPRSRWSAREAAATREPSSRASSPALLRTPRRTPRCLTQAVPHRAQPGSRRTPWRPLSHQTPRKRRLTSRGTGHRSCPRTCTSRMRAGASSALFAARLS